MSNVYISKLKKKADTNSQEGTWESYEETEWIKNQVEMDNIKNCFIQGYSRLIDVIKVLKTSSENYTLKIYFLVDNYTINKNDRGFSVTNLSAGEIEEYEEIGDVLDSIISNNSQSDLPIYPILTITKITTNNEEIIYSIPKVCNNLIEEKSNKRKNMTNDDDDDYDLDSLNNLMNTASINERFKRTKTNYSFGKKRSKRKIIIRQLESFEKYLKGI